MRTLRPSLVGTVILTLLAVMAGMVLARTDGSTKVAGTVLSGISGAFGEFTEDGTIGEDWVGHGRGFGGGVRVEWSDPRLPAEVHSVGNFEAYGDESDGDVGAVVISNTWLLQDDDGYWTGPWTGWCDTQEHCRALVTLAGHDAYEGLFAVLTVQPQADEDGMVTQVYEGAILAGEMPPVPEPLEPTAE